MTGDEKEIVMKYKELDRGKVQQLALEIVVENGGKIERNVLLKETERRLRLLYPEAFTLLIGNGIDVGSEIVHSTVMTTLTLCLGELVPRGGGILVSRAYNEAYPRVTIDEARKREIAGEVQKLVLKHIEQNGAVQSTQNEFGDYVSPAKLIHNAVYPLVRRSFSELNEEYANQAIDTALKELFADQALKGQRDDNSESVREGELRHLYHKAVVFQQERNMT